jgi:hypothetical protein
MKQVIVVLQKGIELLKKKLASVASRYGKILLLDLLALTSLRNWPSLVAPQSMISDLTLHAHRRLHG